MSRTVYSRRDIHSGPIPAREQLDPGPIGRWLKRNFGHVPQTDLAERVGLSERTIVRLLKGEHGWTSVDVVDLITTRLGYPWAWEELYPEWAALDDESKAGA